MDIMEKNVKCLKHDKSSKISSLKTKQKEIDLGKKKTRGGVYKILKKRNYSNPSPTAKK
jgi:hypothetical protein